MLSTVPLFILNTLQIRTFRNIEPGDSGTKLVTVRQSDGDRTVSIMDNAARVFNRVAPCIVSRLMDLSIVNRYGVWFKLFKVYRLKWLTMSSQKGGCCITSII